MSWASLASKPSKPVAPMKKKVESLEKTDPLQVDLLQTVFSEVMQEDMTLKEYLEDPNHIIFLYRDQFYLSSINSLSNDLTNTNLILYQCKKEDEFDYKTQTFTDLLPKDIKSDTIYLKNTMSFGGVFLMNEIKKINTEHRFYKILPTMTLPHTISHTMYQELKNYALAIQHNDDTENWRVSSSVHCGKGTHQVVLHINVIPVIAYEDIEQFQTKQLQKQKDEEDD